MTVDYRPLFTCDHCGTQVESSDTPAGWTIYHASPPYYSTTRGPWTLLLCPPCMGELFPYARMPE